jgi:hypothetical protein
MRKVAVLTSSFIQGSRNTCPCVTKVGGWERMGALVAESTEHEDEIGLKHALQLGVALTIIVLTIVLSWQW